MKRNWAIILLKTSWLLGYAFSGPAVWTWPVFTCSEIILQLPEIIYTESISVLGMSFCIYALGVLILAILSCSGKCR